MAIARLSGTVKHYDWGGNSFIPDLLNIVNADNKPFAEYWMGVHPQADCILHFADGTTTGLREYIATNSSARLGKYVAEKFHDLPYLFKALDVRGMLSIQVHPSKSEAEKDFEAEELKGIPLTDPARNYKDRNHKPELMVAMDDFWLLHGFRPVSEMKQILTDIPELNSLLPIFADGNYTALYKHVMEMPQNEVNKTLRPLLDRIIPQYKNGGLQKSDPSFWAARADLEFSREGKSDRGIFSVYIFNLVNLQRGQAVFQDAGVPHAYLEGKNVEIMASSDNVLRGGLTTKHIDVKELLKHVKCEATHPNILNPPADANAGKVFKTPAPDFELSSFELNAGLSVQLQPLTAEILLVVEGEVEITDATGDASAISLRKGNPSGIVFPNGTITIKAIKNSLVFKAGVPVDK